MSSQKTVKLHNPFVPKAYHLKVTVDLLTWSYSAEEEVVLHRASGHDASAGADPAVIQLHAAPTIDVQDVSGATLEQRDAESQTLSLRLDNPDEPEPRVSFRFLHTINKELRGFYRVTFQHDGKEHRMASTHFEPTSARLFYICQDEPACRADFSLSVCLPAADSHYTVLSNGPLKSKTTVPGKDLVQYSFETIPKCPSYLTACVVGELEHVTTKAGDIPVSVYCSLGKLDRAQFALDTTCYALQFFEKFFQHKYPLPKLDVVAVPDFPIGGMENWGCITCIESILIDEKTASVAGRKRASELLCHEVSHNWVGNLVAINWWEGLWLKEGFASWCGNYASHERYPSWRCLEDAARQVSAAMEMDSYEHSHPVEVPIRDPADITQIFDGISYDKGMGLFFMLQAFLGPKWSAAAAHYIDKYAFKDTKTVQLWEAFEESSGQPVKEAMNSFTSQMGYPMIHVERVAADRVQLRQEPCKFASSPAAKADPSVWCVPVVIAGANGERATAVVHSRDAVEVDLPAALAAESWLTANPERAGFYRCRYDNATFERWVQQYGSLSVAHRCALIADTVAAIHMGYDDVARFVQVASAVRETEMDISVLRQFQTAVSDLAASMQDPTVSSGILRGQLSIFLAKAEALLGEPGAMKPTPEEELRCGFLLSSALAQVLRLTGTETKPLPAHQSLVDWALKEANNFLRGEPCNHATLTHTLAIYARLADGVSVDERNEKLFAKFLECDGNDELCRALLYGMCQSPDTAFVKSIADRCAVGDKVRAHFGGNVFYAMSTNPSFREYEIWTYFKANFPAIDKQWGGGQFRCQVIVKMVGSSISGEASAKDFADFFRANPMPNARLEVGRSTENILLRAWLNKKWCAAEVMKLLF